MKEWESKRGGKAFESPRVVSSMMQNIKIRKNIKKFTVKDLGSVQS